MFKKILEKLATPTESDTALGSDIDDMLHEIVNTECKTRLGHNNQLGDVLFVSAYSKWAERCAFELGIIEILTGEEEGQVVVDRRLAQQLLETIIVDASQPPAWIIKPDTEDRDGQKN